MWGNGAATCRVFAQQGCKIFGCDLNLPSAENTKKRIEAEGGEMTVVKTDVTRDDDVKKLVDAVMEKYGRIDVLVKYVPGPWYRGRMADVGSVTLACHRRAARPRCRQRCGTHRWM